MLHKRSLVLRSKGTLFLAFRWKEVPTDISRMDCSAVIDCWRIELMEPKIRHESPNFGHNWIGLGENRNRDPQNEVKSGNFHMRIKRFSKKNVQLHQINKPLGYLKFRPIYFCTLWRWPHIFPKSPKWRTSVNHSLLCQTTLGYLEQLETISYLNFSIQ